MDKSIVKGNDLAAKGFKPLAVGSLNLILSSEGGEVKYEEVKQRSNVFVLVGSVEHVTFKKLETYSNMVRALAQRASDRTLSAAKAKKQKLITKLEYRETIQLKDSNWSAAKIAKCQLHKYVEQIMRNVR